MQNQDKTLLQKLKDNAFYIALGLGLLAILAIVAIYTVEQGNAGIAENEIDINQASDYSAITTQEAAVEKTNAKTANQSGTENRNTTKIMTEEEKTEAEDEATETADVSVDKVEDTEKEGSTEETDTDQLPVAGNVAELNFTSDKTLAWPIAGKVILPYSMETTVYFKTLEQYQCNPGMLIAGGSGTTVKNAFLGKVTEVTSDNIYGNVVTLYVGNDYSIVYGQLDTVYVNEGDYVKAGESIGTVGKPTDSFMEEGSHLFFQMLDGSQPVDPMIYMDSE